MIEGFRFYSWPWLIGIPIAVGFLLWYGHPKRGPQVIFSSLDGLIDLPKSWIQKTKPLLLFAEFLGFALFFVALARPQYGRSESRISGQGIAIEMVLDVSGSMEALDFQLAGREVDRLTAVKKVVRVFVIGSSTSGLAGRRDDQIGLIAFGGFADSKCPLTLDHGALVEMVDALQVPKLLRDRRGRVVNEEAVQEERATAIGDGLALGVDRLRSAKAKSKVVVLLTDGDNNAGAVDPREAASIAKELGVKVYTIGIGRTGTVPFPQEDRFGGIIYVPTQFRVDEELLKEIATTTGGSYFHAADSVGLFEVYAQIDRLEKSDLEEAKFANYMELYPWFASVGFLMLGLVHVMRQTRFRSLV